MNIHTMSEQSKPDHASTAHPHADANTKGEETAAPTAATPDADEVERLKAEAKQAKDQYLRTVAEFENTKKRLHREKEEFIRYAAETMVRELLPIVDSLDQALLAVDSSTPPARFASQSEAAGVARPFDSVPRIEGNASAMSAGLRKQADVQAFMRGVELIHRQLLGLLAKEGVQRIPAIGHPFDPHKHEAVAQVETSDGTADDTIVEEVQVGYTMHGKVIRPAMVKVAKRNRDQKSEVRNQKSEENEQNQTSRPADG